MAQSGVSEFKTAREAMASPLARRLFGIDGVSSVFFGGDFVTVSKSDEYPWSVLKPDIFAAIMDHYTSGISPPPLSPTHPTRVRVPAPTIPVPPCACYVMRTTCCA